MSESEILKKDIQTTVYHELGHYYVARELGIVSLKPEFHQIHDKCENVIDERLYTGRVRIMLSNPDNNRMIGLGGHICEYMLSVFHDEEGFHKIGNDFYFVDEREIEDDINDLICNERISESDKNLIGEFNTDDIINVLDILKKRWHEIHIEANLIIDDLYKQIGL